MEEKFYATDGSEHDSLKLAQIKNKEIEQVANETRIKNLQEKHLKEVDINSKAEWAIEKRNQTRRGEGLKLITFIGNETYHYNSENGFLTILCEVFKNQIDPTYGYYYENAEYPLLKKWLEDNEREKMAGYVLSRRHYEYEEYVIETVGKIYE